MALDSLGRIFTWGKCHVGQLGHGEEEKDLWGPTCIESLRSVVKIASGMSNVLALDGNFVWGSNS